MTKLVNQAMRQELSFQREETSSELTTAEEASSEAIAPSPAGWWTPVTLILVAWIFVLFKQALSLKRFQKREIQPRKAQRIPCSKCRFLHPNPYIQCAVHPSKALKSDAIGCPDYWAHDSNTFSPVGSHTDEINHG